MDSRITRKGQITIPKAVREHLGVKPGDRVKFFILRNRKAVLLPTIPVAALKGVLKASHPVTIDEMNQAPAAAASERDARSREE